MPTLSPSMNTMELLHYKPQRCTWCGEVAEETVYVMPRTYIPLDDGPTPLCGPCLKIEQLTGDLEVIVSRAEYLLQLSPAPQPDEVVEHKHTAWRGIGDVLATDGPLTQVAWPNGSVLWHLTTDLRRMHARRARPEDNYPRERFAA